jgi:predicted transcriptional regulator
MEVGASKEMVCHLAILCHTVHMTAKVLTDALERVETWPEEAQEELAGIAIEMDAALKDGAWHPTAEELAGIDRGLRAAERGHFAAPENVAAVLAKHRPV